MNSSFGKNYMLAQVPPTPRGNYDHLTYDELHGPRRRRGFAGKDSGAVLKTRLASIDEVDQKRKMNEAAAMGTSETLHGKRNRATVGAVEHSEELLGNQEKRCLCCGLGRSEGACPMVGP